MICDKKDYAAHVPEWCPGCGNYDTLDVLQQALCDLEIKPTDFMVAAGIGQTSKMGFSLKCNQFDGLHGRALPVALGMKMANHKAKVIVIAGDGDLYSEGGNHFIHNARRNLDVTVMAGDNRVFGLTKGQAAPTADYDFVTKIHPEGVGAQPLNPALLALVSGASFVARAFSGDRDSLLTILKAALTHRGFALVDILFPCISFNKINTYAWFKEHVTPIDPSYDTGDFHAALKLSTKNHDQIPIGILYQKDKPVFGDNRKALSGDPIVFRTQSYTPARVKPLFEKFK